MLQKIKIIKIIEYKIRISNKLCYKTLKIIEINFKV